MRALRLLPTLLLMLATALAAVALAPSASAGCVPRGDGQDLVCAGAVYYETGTCVSYFVNPPAPGTSVGGYACQPVDLCSTTACARWVCVARFCFIIGVNGGGALDAVDAVA